jgi:hypothetical protein
MSGRKSSTSEGNERHQQESKHGKKLIQLITSFHKQWCCCLWTPLLHFKPALPTAMMSMRVFVVVSVLVLSCIFLSTTRYGGIQFSYHPYVTTASASIMTVVSNYAGQKQSIARSSKKPPKIVTPEEAEEKKQEFG